MFPPISFNVIRQCLDKMGLPTPHLRVLSSYKLPDGTWTAEYLLSFASLDIQRWVRGHHCGGDLGGYTCFRKRVSEAFSTDITVLEEYDNSRPGYHGLIAHVRVPRHAEQMEMFDDVK